LLYSLFLFLYKTGIRVSSIKNTKARLWLKGRQHIFKEIDEKLQKDGRQRLWMHCASLGEFEQGRPVLEALKTGNDNLQIILTFFSPSGYEVMKNYKGADHIFYLPMDSAANAERFINVVEPSLVLWVKYEYWYYYLTLLKKKNIPVILVSGIFRSSQPFFKWYGKLWRKMLEGFTVFFVQNEDSKKLLATLKITDNVFISGDTRFDRVIAIAEKFEPIPAIEKFCAANKVIVAGSTWEDDEAEMIHYVRQHPEIKFIIAPHEIDEENIAEVQKEFSGSTLFSAIATGEYRQAGTGNVLIIDNVGMLSRLYKYADVAYIGGGFGSDGIHNVLEAAVYGKPVVFGPVYAKYAEAIGLVENDGAISITNALELENVFDELLGNDKEKERRGTAAKGFVYMSAGATKKIIDHIQEKRLLTNR